MKNTKIRHLGSLFVAAFLLIAANIIVLPDAAFAAPPDCKGKNKGAEGCDGGSDDGGTNTPKVIGVHKHDRIGGQFVWAPTDTLASCVLQQNSGNSLSGAFPRHAECAALITSGDALTDDIIIVVDTDKQGMVVGVQVQGQDVIGAEAFVYISDIVVPYSVVKNDDGTMIIHVDAQNVTLYKCDTHVLKRKSVCTEVRGIFALHDLVYSSQL